MPSLPQKSVHHEHQPSSMSWRSWLSDSKPEPFGKIQSAKAIGYDSEENYAHCEEQASTGWKQKETTLKLNLITF